MTGWRCTTCGNYHDELPLVYGPDAPAAWAGLPERERAARGELTSDQCIIDGRHFFLRGLLEIPIAGGTQTFAWLVWTSVSEASFLRASELWETPEREREPPYFGWLNSELSAAYGVSTIDLRTRVHTRPVGQRPFVEVEPTSHPLAVEQREGITWARVREIAERMLHPV